MFVVGCDGEREREECVWVDFRGLDWWRFCGAGGMAGWEGWSPVLVGGGSPGGRGFRDWVDLCESGSQVRG